MTSWVALLRGINVGGKTSMAMADLRHLVEALGHTDVTTVLQSGNVVFTSSRRSPDELASQISAAIAEQMGKEVKVLVRSGTELARIVAANPFPDAVSDPKRLHVVFLSATPDLSGLDANEGPDRVAPGEGVLYVSHSDGMQGSPLAKHLTEKKLGVTMTARNWNTVTKLAEMTR
jgi:uncharacterized protein (DUF1697 family)